MKIIDHVLMDPDFHDGQISSVEIKNGCLKMTCSTLHGVEYEVQLPGVTDLQVKNFREGNIIFEILLFTGNQCPIPLLEQVLDNTTVPHNNHFEKEFERITKNNELLLALTSSYGCELLALSKDGLDALILKQL